MHIDLMFPSKYLKAADLRGKDAALTIRHVIREEVQMKDGNNKQKWVLYFKEAKESADKSGQDEKRLPLNITNARSIAKATGEKDGEKWIGRRIILYATTCQSFGETVDCIRVREYAPPVNGTATPTTTTEPEVSGSAE